MISDAFRRGRAEGLILGLRERVAARLFKEAFSDEKIAAITDLPLEQIKALHQKQDSDYNERFE